MPYNTPRTWADGELVTAAQLNQDVRDNMGAVNTVATNAQTVANQGHRILTTTQKNALTGVVTGTMVYDSTLGLMQMWNGVGWLATGGYTPLVPSSVALNYGAPTTNTNTTISWSGVRHVSIDGIFNTNLRQYRMILKTTATSSVGDTASFYFRDGSGDRTSSTTLGTSYILTRDNNNAATFSFPNQASKTIQVAVANLSSFAPNTASKFEFYDVGSATLASWEAWMIGAYTNVTPGAYLVQRGIGWDIAAAERTGLTLFCGSGQTWSGSVSFYGMA